MSKLSIEQAGASPASAYSRRKLGSEKKSLLDRSCIYPAKNGREGLAPSLVFFFFKWLAPSQSFFSGELVVACV